MAYAASMLSALAGLAILFAVATVVVVGLYVGMVVHETLSPPRGATGFALARGLPTQPSDLGLEARSFSLTIGGPRDRSQMPVWEVVLDDASEPLSIVLVHGWGRSRIDSLSRLPPLLAVADRVYLLDLRGHGDADGRTTLGTREHEDLAALVATLPPGPVVLAGHSLGATVCIRCAAVTSVAPRIAGVIAIAPYDTVATPIAARLAARELPGGVFLRMILSWLRLRGIERPSTIDAARQLNCPLLVLHGARDRISPPSEGKAIADAASGTYVSMEDVEHADHHHREPQRLAVSVREFVDHVRQTRVR